jgi:hypothetical protein
MDSQGIVFFILAILFFWLIALSIVLYRIFRHFKTLSKDVTGENLLSLLSSVIDSEKENSRAIGNLARSLQETDEEAKSHVQKVRLIRFNPFKELGGDHSFALTLLDAKDNGVIITGLHTRERTRVYIKEVKKGRVNVELSSEESQSLKEAQKK